MSPDERQLRAALHDGEGQPVDADAVIDRALIARRQRRLTVSAVGGAVAAVLVVGVGVGVVAANRPGRAPAVAAAASAPSVRSGGAAGDQQSASAAQTAPASTASTMPHASTVPPGSLAPATCPAQVPRIVAPSGAGADGPLFPAGVTSIRVCVYQADLAARIPDTSGVAGSYLVTGSDAERLAQQFNDLAAAPLNTPCTADIGPWVALFGATATDQAAPVVGNLGGCGTTTDGGAVRQARGLLQQLTHRALPHLSTPGRMSHGPGPS